METLESVTVNLIAPLNLMQEENDRVLRWTRKARAKAELTLQKTPYIPNDVLGTTFQKSKQNKRG